MPISENIKKLRISQHLTQQEFANRIGVKRNTVATYEMGRSEPSDAAVMLICREFGVRREWLETGEGEMYSQHNDAIIQQLMGELSLDAKSIEFLGNFLRLTPENRKLVATGLEQAAKLYPRREEPTRKRDEELTREEMHAMLDAELDAQEAAAKRATSTSSASTSSSGSVLKFGKSP